jgi:hypothetical protein
METAANPVLDLVGFVATIPNLLICVAVWSIIQTVTKLAPKIFESSIALRAKPLAAILFCVGACFIPSVQPVDMTAGNRILLGVVLGTFAGQVHKILKQSILGHGAGREPKSRIEKAIS